MDPEPEVPAAVVEREADGEEEHAPLSWKTRIMYSLGSVPVAQLQDVPGLFISPFLLEVVRLSPGTLGQLFLGAKIFDALTDPVLGVLTDRTRSRFGRRRPWMFVAMLTSVLSNMLLWHVLPAGSAAGATAAYYFVWMCITAMSVTMFLVPYSSLTNEVTLVDQHRSLLTEGRAAVNFVATLIGVMVIGLIVDEALADRPEVSYFYANIVITAMCAGGMACVIWGVHAPHEAMHVVAVRSLKEETRWTLRALRQVVSQREFWSLATVATLNWVSLFLVTNNMYLYVDYAVEMPQYFTVIMVVALGSSVAWVFAWRFVIRRWSKRVALLIGQVALLGTYLCIILAPASNMGFIMVVAVCTGASLSAVNLHPWTNLPDVIDYDEYRFGERREGISTAFIVLFNKVSTGLALALSGFLLEVGGYDNSEGVPERSEEINRTLRLLCGIIPAGMAVVAIPFILMYPVTAKKHKEVAEDIKKRREGALPAASGEFVPLIASD